MTVIQAINEVDNLKPNMYELPEKIKWLSRLDTRIFEQIYLTHELSDEEKEPFLPEEEEEEDVQVIYVDCPPWAHEKKEKLEFKGYTEEDTDKELLVGEPYDEMYVFWLSAQIDQNNMEYQSFNNTNALFESVYGAFRNAFNRTHEPLGKRKIYY